MTDPAKPPVDMGPALEAALANPQQDIIGRQASALDSISEVANGLLEFLKAATLATDQAISMAKDATKRARVPEPNMPSLAEIRAMTSGLPKEDREEIEAAVKAQNPREALRLLKEKVKRDGGKVVERNTSTQAKDQADAHARLENCTLFNNGKTQRDTVQQVMAVVQFVDSFCAWLDSVVDLMPADSPDKSLDGFGRALRCMGFIKSHVAQLNEENPTDPTRRMLHEIFDKFGMSEGHTSVVDIVSYAASTMPELADAVMSLTGHEYTPNLTGLGRWQVARKVLKDGRTEDQALGHLANKLMNTPEFREHVTKAIDKSFVVGAAQVGPAAAARAWIEHMRTYEGPLEAGWCAIALTLEECLAKLEEDHGVSVAQSPASRPVLE